VKKHQQKVLVLDGHQRSALAVVRSLGQQNLTVLVAATHKDSLAGVSRFCEQTFSYCDPLSDQKGFTRDIAHIVEKEGISLVIPVTDLTTYSLLKHAHLNNSIKVAAPSFNQYSKASDKINLVQMAKRHNVPCPESFVVSSLKEWEDLKISLKFPVIFKPSASIQEYKGKLITTSVKIVNSWREGKNLIESEQGFGSAFLVQEKIDGAGEGIFVLVDHGKLVTVFSHKRIREKPPWGGVSVLCKSNIPADDTTKYAARLLNNLNWHGVAMVEFKRDYKTDIPYLMEINARFWGTLQLAVDCGIDFPYWQYLLFSGKAYPHGTTHIDKRLRWLLGDLDNLIISLRQELASRTLKWSFFKKKLIDFMLEFNRSTCYQVIRADDIKPFIWELKQYIKELLKNG